MINAAKFFAVLAAVMLLQLLQNKINVRKEERGRQVYFPLIALIYVALSAFLDLRLYFWIKSLNPYGREGGIFLAIYRWLRSVTALRNFLVGAAPAFLNVVLVLGFIVIKLILKKLIGISIRQKTDMPAAAENYYKEDRDLKIWVLQDGWRDFRDLMHVFSWCAALFCGLLLGIGYAAGLKSPLHVMAFPCAAMLVINEIRDFLDGYTKWEYGMSVSGENASANRVSAYFRVREILEKLFAPQLLSAHTGSEFGFRLGVTDEISRLVSSEDRLNRSAGEFYRTRGARYHLDPDSVTASVDLLHGRNVIFLNPFYRDLGEYVLLPIVSTLLGGKNILIISGRNSTREDIRTWMAGELNEYSRMQDLWRVSDLSERDPQCEVGILGFTQIYEPQVIDANRKFFKNTGFVFLIEPSRILNTGQIGLSLLAKGMNNGVEHPVYCVCDRNAEGLVDTLSHLFRTEFTDVAAMPEPHCIYTGMSWNANGDYIRQSLFNKETRYLGNGTELAAVAVRNQIPVVPWYSETKAPVRDIRWIAEQYYPAICSYANLPSQQKSMDEKFRFISNLWSSPQKKEAFIVVEDEFCNMFSTMRVYLSRGREQAFVNVLSENYLLRDYMRCNHGIFETDPSAVPSLVPDFAKTERNVILKLIILMANRPVTENEIRDEYSLIGIRADDISKLLAGMIRKYTFATEDILTMEVDQTVSDADSVSNRYFISPAKFEKYFADSLKNAYYLLEDEKRESDYIDAKLFEHVTQTNLPGQFVTYDGKYYQVKSISPENGIILRRASNLYRGRIYYRQVRKYHFENQEKPEPVSGRKVMDIEISYVRRNFSVETSGYLELNDNNDLRTARNVDFLAEKGSDVFYRKYRNKTVLCLRLPDTTSEIRFTLCMLIAELFRTLFPDAWPYLAVLSDRPGNTAGMINYLVYQSDGIENPEEIYIVEDSDIDLGLLGAVERNLPRIFSVLADYLDWHFEKMVEPAAKDPVMGSVALPKEEIHEAEKKRGLFARMANMIHKLFTGNKKAEPEPEVPDLTESPAEPKSTESGEKKEGSGETPAEGSDAKTEGKPQEYSLDGEPEEKAETDVINKDDAEKPLSDMMGPEESGDPASAETAAAPEAAKKTDESKATKDQGTDRKPDIINDEEGDLEGSSGMPEEIDLIELGLPPIEKTRYQKECYLKFGFEEIDNAISIDDVRKYLTLRGWSQNALTKARKREQIDMKSLDPKAENHCDFCGRPISGVSYEKLNDGRIRCNDCSGSAVNSVGEFRDLFMRTLDLMQGFFHIEYRVSIDIHIADANEIAARSGSVFRPSTETAARTLGFAKCDHGSYSICMENGSPRLAAIETLSHELTHIWQFLNWNEAEISSIYGTGKNRDMVYEGMAVWISIQYLYLIGENTYAADLEQINETRNDVYGQGFLYYREKYPLTKNSSLLNFSPFTTFPPL